MIYPESASARDRWILSRRGPKNSLDVFRPYAYLSETERGPNGQMLSTATIFLTNRECTFKCLMCDLWRNTLDKSVPSGAIPEQIKTALQTLSSFPSPNQIKLYNAGSFFDAQAIPPDDYKAIADQVSSFDRVIVECHPAVLLAHGGELCLKFRDSIHGQLEVAIGLETIHTEVLEKLNKRMNIDLFRRAADFLRQHKIDLRVFILLKPPFLNEAEGLHWACRSIDFALGCGASVAVIIPTRGGNGAMEAIDSSFTPPTLQSLEKAHEYGLSLKQARVFADLWDAEKFSPCDCASLRIQRLAEMNHTQVIVDQVECEWCN